MAVVRVNNLNDYEEDIILISGTSTETDEFGNPISEPTRTEIQATKKDISQSEFYQAAQANIRPAVEFIVNADEFNGEPLVEWQGSQYSINRTYQRNLDEVELYLEQKVGDLNG